MVGPAKASEKRQSSLTSFFTRKTVNGLSQSPSSSEAASQNATGREEAAGVASSRKRPLGEDTDHGNDSPDNLAKRSKVSSAGSDKSTFFQKKTTASESKPSPSGPTPTPRAGHYAYDPSRASRSEGNDQADDGTALESKEKEDLHRKFVAKLGRPESLAQLKRRNFQIDEDTSALDGQGGEDADGGDDAEEDEPPPPPKGKKKGAKAAGKLTPMEIQFLDIKRKHMDTVLIVEVGYKFKFFGEDARIAAKELSIVCIPGKFRYDEHPSEAHLDRFASASIPVHRLPVHAKRLVAAGHKVGVVRQIETAALKKAGNNKSGPFIRQLTNVYTKGTYIDEIGELDQPGDKNGSPSGGYLLCITESKAKGSGTDENVHVGLIAVQPATGDIIYDDFEDGFMRREIETRLLHIAPVEFLIVGELTKATDKLIQHLSGSKTNVFGDRSRVERVAKSKTMAAEAHSHVTQFYAGKTGSQHEHSAALLEKVLKLSEPVTICHSAMINHLTEYGLEHIFDLTKYFQSFSTRQNMLINGTTLESLEVYRNSTDHTEKGSLVWALDKTYTRFGQRLLRKWIGRPLLDKARLEARVSAVEEIVENQSTKKTDQLEFLLRSTKTDLERSLIRIFYGKCSRPELLSTLQTLQRISQHYSQVKSPADTGFKSDLISNAICALPPIGDIVITYLNKINAEAAREDDKYAFFRELEETDDISTHKLGIAAVEQDLDDHRKAAASMLSDKTPVTYVTVAGIEYLIEVPNSNLKRVPASWAKISGTKKLSRFHTPEVVRWLAERDQHKEALAAACDAAFTAMLQSLAAEYQPLRDAVSSLATLDCLLSYARVAALPGYTKPEFMASDSPPSVSITKGRHPIAEITLPNGYIPFTTSLGAPGPLAHLITGPNMGGKSSYVRAVALLVLLAQIGSFVPAEAMSLTLTDAIHTRMGARDNLFAGESTFMVEVSETAAILRAATPRSLVVLDELGRGTSTHDGAAIAHAVLDHIVRDVGCLTLFITHYQNLARVADALGDGLVRCVHMRFTARKPSRRLGLEDKENTLDAPGSEDDSGDNDKENDDDEITFLYEVGDGVAHRSYGLNVARLARIPRKVLDVAATKSRELEAEITKRRLRATARLLADVLHNRPDQLDHLISGIEQL